MIQPAYRTIGRVFGWTVFGAWVALWMWYFLYDGMVYWGLSRFIPGYGYPIALIVAAAGGLKAALTLGKGEDDVPQTAKRQSQPATFRAFPGSMRDLAISLAPAVPPIGALAASNFPPFGLLPYLSIAPLVLLHAVIPTLRRKVSRHMIAAGICITYQLALVLVDPSGRPSLVLRPMSDVGALSLIALYSLSVLQVSLLLRARMWLMAVQAALFSQYVLLLVSMAIQPDRVAGFWQMFQVT